MMPQPTSLSCFRESLWPKDWPKQEIASWKRLQIYTGTTVNHVVLKREQP
jgi:hypothetical protein